MHTIMISLLWATVVAGAADDKKLERQTSGSELCSIRTVAVVGHDNAAKEIRKQVEKKTWMKRVGKPEKADGILDVETLVTTVTSSPSGNKVHGLVSMRLKRRQPEKTLWTGMEDLDTGNVIDALLTSLQKEAGCGKR